MAAQVDDDHDTRPGGAARRVGAAHSRTRSAVGVPGGRSSPTASWTRCRIGCAIGLWHLGVRPGDRVGLRLHKSIDGSSTIFGILKAGAAYVPVDAESPAARGAYILNDCQVKVVVTGARARRPRSPRSCGGSARRRPCSRWQTPTAPPGVARAARRAAGERSGAAGADGDSPVRTTSPTSSTRRAPRATRRASCCRTGTPRASSTGAPTRSSRGRRTRSRRTRRSTSTCRSSTSTCR